MAQVNSSNDDNVKNDATAYGAVADGEKEEPRVYHWMTLAVMIGVPFVLFATLGVKDGVNGLVTGFLIPAFFPYFAVMGIRYLVGMNPYGLQGSGLWMLAVALSYLVYLALLAGSVVLHDHGRRVLCVFAIMAFWAFAFWSFGIWAGQGC